jgi:hypothetical protein
MELLRQEPEWKWLQALSEPKGENRAGQRVYKATGCLGSRTKAIEDGGQRLGSK